MVNRMSSCPRSLALCRPRSRRENKANEVEKALLTDQPRTKPDFLYKGHALATYCEQLGYLEATKSYLRQKLFYTTEIVHQFLPNVHRGNKANNSLNFERSAPIYQG